MAAPPPPGPPLSTKGGLIGLVFALLVLTGVGAAIAVPEMNRDDHKDDHHGEEHHDDEHGEEHHDDEHGDDHDDHDHDEEHGDDHADDEDH